MAHTNEASPLQRSQFICPACPEQDDKGAFFFPAELPNFHQNADGYFVATCPQCGNPDCREPWYMAQCRKAQGKQTGPVTEAGKNKTRMNGYRTGSSYASGAIPKYIPPAKPEKYAECDECQDLDQCKAAVAEAMGTSRYVACHRLGELIAKYRNAHMTGDPEALRFTAADVHAKMHRVMNQCFKAIFDHGIYINSVILSNGQPVYVTKGEGDNARRIPLVEKKINPTVNEAIKILEKMGFGLADWTLTPKSKEAKAALEGYLAGRAAEKGQDMDEFIRQQNKDIQNMREALARGNEAMKNDETLQESLAEEREGKEQ